MDIKQRLDEFITWWREYITGDEKSEAQTFLDHFVQALGHPGALEVGRYEERVRRKRNGKTAVSYADYVMHKRALIEMKKRGENLAHHYDQLEDYWKQLEAKPRYAILCNFDEIWIYAFPTQFYEPIDRIKISELSQRTAALEFMIAGSNREPIFQNNLVEVTKEAAISLSKVFRALMNRQAVEIEVAQRYVLQCMLALFAEDIDLLPNAMFTRQIEAAQRDEGSSYDLIGSLFVAMNRPGKEAAGRYYGVDYFNGGIFKDIMPIALSTTELNDLREAARQNWSRVKPAIFGTIFEQSMTEEERHRIGAHFTNEQDIKLIVDPVIVHPWDDRIEQATTAEALLQLHSELCQYTVLDPACGSGNFLYIAYIEMKKLERRIFNALEELGADLPQVRVSVKQFYGFDIRPFAVELAKVTLMIAKKVSVDAIGSDENPLPLDNMDANIREADALFTEWPEFDACIGNPPYMGAKRLKQEHPVAYINRIRDAFPDVPGNADYCVYWFRKAHELMKTGSRAGLVGTNTIRQNYSREGGLDYIVANDGHIYDAISSKPWSGEAAVSVSIVCWSKGQPPVSTARLRYYMGVEDENGNGNGNGHKNGNGDEKAPEIIWREVELPEINSALSEFADVSGAKVLSINTAPKRVFQGQTPGHKGFVLSKSQAGTMIAADAKSKEVIFPYMTGGDIVSKPRGLPSRYIIDFEERDLLDSQAFKRAYKHIETTVLPDKKTNAEEEEARNKEIRQKDPGGTINTHHQNALNQWWLHFYNRSDRNAALVGKKRCIACSRISKRNIFDFISVDIKPSDKVQTFIFDDDYSFGVLQSNLHWQWWLAKGATLTERPSYTPSSIFDTFPWPQNPTPEQIKAVAEAGRALHEYRREQMAKREDLTLRDMYRLLELPGKNPLRDLHTALDKAVMATYGFDPEQDILSQLLALNLDVSAKIEAGQVVTAPGIPPGYPNPAELVSEGCIQPPELI